MQVNRLMSGQSNNRQMHNKVRCNKMCEIGCQIGNKELEQESEMQQHEQHEKLNKRQFEYNLLRRKLNNNCSVDDDDDDGMISKEKQISKYDADKRPSNTFNKEKTKSRTEEHFKFAESSALRNYGRSTMENDEFDAYSDKNVPERDDVAVKCDANHTPNNARCHNIGGKSDDICTYGVNANGQCVLFEANIPVLIKLHEREENVRFLGVTVLAGNKSANTTNSDSVNYFFQSSNVSNNSNNNNSNTNGSRSGSAFQSSSSISIDVITIRITDTANPFLLFELEIHEEDYIAFKQRLELLVDFATFPSYLVNLLCNVQQQHENALYKMTFTMHRGDADRATLRVIEPTQFKTVEHLSLQLIRQGDVGQKHYLAERFQYFANALTCSERQRERVTRETESEIAQLHKELHTLHDEYDAFRERTSVNAALADKEHVTNLAHEREMFHSELTQMQMSYEDKLHTAERTAIEKEHKLTSSIREKEETLRQLREEKEKATTELTLLRSQLRLVEETNNAQEQELQRLRETNAELVNFKTEATRAMSNNEISYVSLTERLHAASSSLRNREDELASLRASYEKQDKYIHMLTEQNEQLKEQGKVNEQALGKTHHIISHQLETIKGIKERHKITLNQLHNERALLRDKDMTLQQVQKELASISNQLEDYTCKNSKLESELERCNEARERLSTELQQTQAALLHIQKSNVTNILSNGASNYYNNNSGMPLSNRRYGANRSFSALPLSTGLARMQSNSYPTENIPYQQHSNINNIYHKDSRYNQHEENKTANVKATEIPLVTTAGAITKFFASPLVSSPASIITHNSTTNDMGLTVETSTNKSNSKVSREPSNDHKLLYEYDGNKNNRGYNVNYCDADKVVVDVTRTLTNKENCNNNKKISSSASAEIAQLHKNNNTGKNNNKNSSMINGANTSVNLLEEFNKNATEAQGSKKKNITGNYHFQKNVSNDKSNNSNNNNNSNSYSANCAERTAIGITCERSSSDVEKSNKDKNAQPALFAADKSHIHVDNTNQMNKSANANVSSRYTSRANEHKNASVPVLATATTTSSSSFVTQGSGAKTRSRPLLESKPTNFANTGNLMQQTNSSNEREIATAANSNVSTNNLEHKQLRSTRLAAKSFFANQRDGNNISSTLQEQAVSAYF